MLCGLLCPIAAIKDLTLLQGFHISINGSTRTGFPYVRKADGRTTKTQVPLIISQPEDEDVVDRLNKLSLTSEDFHEFSQTTPSRSFAVPEAVQANLAELSQNSPNVAPALREWAHPHELDQAHSLHHVRPTSTKPRTIPWDLFGPGFVGQERSTRYPQRQTWPPTGHSPFFQGRLGHHRENENGSSHHNVVDVERIRNGLDVRTTVHLSEREMKVGDTHQLQIMLRNIPNKIDQVR